MRKSKKKKDTVRRDRKRRKWMSVTRNRIKEKDGEGTC